MFIIYEFLYLVFVLLSIPLLFIKGKWHNRFFMRFGFWKEEDVQELRHPNNIWIHAVSVGEILAIHGMVDQIRHDFPESNIIISTVTKTGYGLAKEKFDEAKVVYAPLDFSFSVNRYISFIRPKIYIAAETEIWPNLFRHLHRESIPIVLVNGRISQRSFQNYRRFNFFFRRLWPFVKKFCMQSTADVQRLKELGVDQQVLQTVGNMKFDGLEEEQTLTPADIGFTDEDFIWVAGSTHPGEEDIVLDAYATLRDKYKNLRIVIAPRHVERVKEISGIIERKGLKPVLYSTLPQQIDAQGVLLVDTIGHLRGIYSLARVVFVGKSLCGVGGQNILEPAAYAKPIIVGPHMENFQDIMNLFTERKAVIKVANRVQLEEQLDRLLGSSEASFQVGAAGYDIVQDFQGSTGKTCKIIAELVKET